MNPFALPQRSSEDFRPLCPWECAEHETYYAEVDHTQVAFEQFQTAIRQGKYKGLKDSRPLMPPMPWQMYQNFTDEDVKAVYSYLKSIKPVDNLVPAYTPPRQ